MREFLPVFLVFAVLWAAQLYATAKQTQAFMRSVGSLRGLGQTAIGASGHDRLRRRSYVSLASDETDLVTGAIELSGVTVFARARPVPELVGVPLRQLADAPDGDRRSNGARMAARALLDEGPDGSTPGRLTEGDAASVASSSGRRSSPHLPGSSGGSGRSDQRMRRS